VRTRAHPAKGVLAVERRRVDEVARGTGYCAAYVGRILNGHIEPTAEFRRRLSAYLGRPESELFDDTPGIAS
jgi:transcriptional regulator with XRE-family HTH domain